MKHKFDIDISMTATISREVSIQMLTDAIEKETGKKVADIRIEYEVNGSAFKGLHVTFDPNSNTKKSFKPSKQFIVEHYGAEE
jgi:hypothetical protein